MKHEETGPIHVTEGIQQDPLAFIMHSEEDPLIAPTPAGNVR